MEDVAVGPLEMLLRLPSPPPVLAQSRDEIGGEDGVVRGAGIGLL
jgi:hypothetical protein